VNFGYNFKTKMWIATFSRFLSLLLVLKWANSHSSSLDSSCPSDELRTVASTFKAPSNSTPPDVVERWSEEDAALWSYVESNVPSVLRHTGAAAFDEHLRGVQSVLRGWGSPDHLTNAGLFHSIYGTEGFQGFALSPSEREAVQGLVGERAERLVWIFCMVDRTTVDRSTLSWAPESISSKQKIKLLSRPELSRFEFVMEKEEWLDLIELSLADWLEQVEGAATKPSALFLWKVGEAYSYRREAYARMADILAAERPHRLGEVVPRMLRDVMATEPYETRHLVQPRTPPMSEAAEIALDVLRAAGEDVPVDFQPQPLSRGRNF